MPKSSRKNRTNQLRTATIISLIAIIVAIFVAYTPPFRVLELKWLDYLFELRGPVSTDDSPIIIVKIDEQTDSELPQKYPYPRSYYAKVVENLNKAGVKTIGFDIILDKPDINNLSSDSAFARTLRRFDNIILAGRVNREQNYYSDFQALVEPAPLFREYNVNRWGFVDILIDSDGFVRRYLLEQNHLDQPYYAFGLELLREYHGWSDTVDVVRRGDKAIFGKYEIPLLDAHSMMINYYGYRDSFQSYSLDQIMDDADFMTNMEDPDFQINGFDDPEYGLLYQGVLEGKIVMIGQTMVEMQDFVSTPFAPSENRPGVEMHAHALQTIIDGNYIIAVDQYLEIVITIFLGIFVCFITLFIRSILSLINMVGLMMLSIVSTYYLFIEANIHLRISSFLLVIFLGYMGSLVYDFIIEQREKRRIKSMFSSYVSPALVEQMVDSEEEPQLGGDESEISAFFSDIQSFSAFSEKLTPTQLVDLINEYLSAMTDIITEEGGTLDKYIGDAIVAFYGAPVPIQNHAYRACVTSQLMQIKQAELREKWKSEGDKWPDVVGQMQTRIGINTGIAVTGNMGSSSRFNYTMMGDNVNLAARCESGAKSYGVYTMVTEETKTEAQKFGEECVFRYLDRIVVKGRTQPVKMFEIVGLKDHLKKSYIDCVSEYEKGIELYLKKEWDEAIKQFQHSSEMEQFKPGFLPGVKTNPSLVMIDRCESMKSVELPEDWDGVYVMTSK
jgi:adenylate cyclase